MFAACGKGGKTSIVTYGLVSMTGGVDSTLLKRKENLQKLIKKIHVLRYNVRIQLIEANKHRKRQSTLLLVLFRYRKYSVYICFKTFCGEAYFLVFYHEHLLDKNALQFRLTLLN